MDQLTYAYYPVFTSSSIARLHETPVDADALADEAANLFDKWSDRVTTRGTYETTGFRADADVMMWWVAGTADDIQQLSAEFGRTQLGRALRLRRSFLGIVRPAEFSKDHVPAFVKSDETKKYLCVYPFVRTPEWYLLDPNERSRLLREHGEIGRQFPDVLANTTSAFGLGDWEWILAFEADELHRIVDCIRALRAAEARRYTKEEVPFVTGIRKPLVEIVRDVV